MEKRRTGALNYFHTAVREADGKRINVYKRKLFFMMHS